MPVIENPFHYGDVASEKYFTNRVREQAELALDVRSGQNVVIISPRRYGKTSLVQKVIKTLRSEGVLIAYVDLFKAPTKERLVRLLAGAILQSLESPLEQKMQQARDLFKGLSVRPRFSMSDEGKPVLELTPAARPSDVDEDLERLLEMPAEIARKRKKRVALVMDEFQEVLTIDPHLPGKMRAIFQHQTDVSHVYLGSKFHLMNQVFNDVNRPFYKSAKHLPLEPISPEDFKRFILERFASTGKQIDAGVVDTILEITGCHPNDTQELCYFTWTLAHAEGLNPTGKTVAMALQQILNAENARYTVIWEDLPPSQRSLLLTLAGAPTTAPFSEEYRRSNALGSASTVQKALKRLRERELVEMRERVGYCIPDVFFRHWLIQRVD